MTSTAFCFAFCFLLACSLVFKLLLPIGLASAQLIMLVFHISVSLFIWLTLFHVIFFFICFASFSLQFNEWQFKSSLFWVKIIYALLSFPFFLFEIPILKSIFTHARVCLYRTSPISFFFFFFFL